VPSHRFSGSKLRAARESHTPEPLSREELGALVDHGGSIITLYELDYRTPPVLVLIDLADALGVGVEDFFVAGGDEVPAPAPLTPSPRSAGAGRARRSRSSTKAEARA
jgi:hypothetical protein